MKLNWEEGHIDKIVPNVSYFDTLGVKVSNFGVDKAMMILQERAKDGVLDYPFVMNYLQGYSSPRAKLTRLLHSQALIHLRKGLYLLGPKFKHAPYCLELLANIIYGPSYISLERALQIYGLIPEHVEMITSVTFKNSKEFHTPVGHFLYAHCHPKSYSLGITTRSFSENENPLIATPEKAIIDMLTIRRGKISSIKQIEHILLEDLRIEEEDLRALDIQQVHKICNAHPHSSSLFFEKWLHNLKGKSP